MSEMPKYIQEMIKTKAFKQYEIESDSWNNNDFKDINLALLNKFKLDGNLDENNLHEFIENLELTLDKESFIQKYHSDIKSCFDNNEQFYEQVLNDFIECETLQEYIYTISDGYSVMLENGVIASIAIK